MAFIPWRRAIRSGSRRLELVSVARERKDERLEGLIQLARGKGVRVAIEPKDQLTRAG